MPDRTISSNEYRYGFNGKENDESGEWGDQLIQDYGFRLYNPAIGKFLSVDPLAPSYPWYTPYQFAGNKVIVAIDLDGLEEVDARTGRVFNKEDTQLKQTDAVNALAEAASKAASEAAKAEQKVIESAQTDYSDPNRTTGGGDQFGLFTNLPAHVVDDYPIRGRIANLTVDVINQTPLGALDNWYFIPEEYRTGREGGDLAMSLIIVKGPAGKGGRYGGNGTYKPRVIERSGKGKASTTNTVNGKVSEVPLESLSKTKSTQASSTVVRKQTSINQLQKEVERNLAPKSIDRFDKGKILGEKDHVHFTDKSALNRDGTWKHGSKQLTSKESKYLEKHGWTLPK